MRTMAFCAVVLFSVEALAFNVLDKTGRSQTLIEYLAARNDLTKAEKATWEKALRVVFGGQALRGGDDEGITAAKSVLSFGLFHRLDAMLVVQAAYDAKNDVYAWVPPPAAIKYQTLVLQGRRPKESSRLLAFEFPKYFDEELAPEMVAWWQEALANGKVNPDDEPRMRRHLAETQKKMKPRARALAYEGAELQASVKKGQASAREVAVTLELLDSEIRGAVGGAETMEYYDLYTRLSKELGLAVQPPPVVKVEPKSEPKPKVKEESKPAVVATPQPKVPSDPLRPAPLANESLCDLYSGWQGVWASAISKFLGTPYLWGGVDRKGIDCSGFSREVFRHAARLELPRVARDQYLRGRALDKSQLKKGDLVFFDTLERGHITHVGVFDGEGILVHATSSRGVTKEKLENRWLQRAYRGSRRVLQL